MFFYYIMKQIILVAGLGIGIYFLCCSKDYHKLHKSYHYSNVKKGITPTQKSLEYTDPNYTSYVSHIPLNKLPSHVYEEYENIYEIY